MPRPWQRRTSFEAFADTPAPAIAYAPDGRAVGGRRRSRPARDLGRAVGTAHRPAAGRPALGPAPIRARRSRSRAATTARSRGRSRSAPEICSPARASAAELRIWDLDTRGADPPAAQPAAVRDRACASAPMGRSSRSRSATAIPGPDGVEVVDVQSGERIARLRAEAEVRSVAFSPDGSLLAVRQVDGNTVLWATDDWQQVGGPLTVDRGFVLGVAFSPDGRDARHIPRRRHGRALGRRVPGADRHAAGRARSTRG